MITFLGLNSETLCITVKIRLREMTFIRIHVKEEMIPVRRPFSKYDVFISSVFFDTKYNVFVGIINDLAVRNIAETSQDDSI